MRVWAYCGADWVRASRVAGGVEPATSPPYDADSVDLAQAAAADVVYLNLHGYRGQPYYYGQVHRVVGPTALTAERVAQYRWHGVVFAEVCFGAMDGGGLIARAFLENGARAFIGSTTEAYGRVRPSLLDGEADRLMWLFRRTYRRIPQAAQALALARRLLSIVSWPLDATDRSTLESFICLEGSKHGTTET